MHGNCWTDGVDDDEVVDDSLLARDHHHDFDPIAEVLK